MRALDLAREKVSPPTPDHEVYRVRHGVPSAHASCALCGDPVRIGLEVAFRLKGSSSRDRRYGYVHLPCLRPIPTYFEEDTDAARR